ncbi:hypothetical protein ACFRAR_28245 [Kitasatospora sp. NPDC056651]|uniref:hypothetical protein n=1 Tax=Kitasatospora sp. NPDC056651 TaxID=3345892 RepID=UPI0036CE60E4
MKPGLVMRYEVVEAAGSHVLRDVVLDEFCMLPDGSGRAILLAFPDALHARLWLMTADTRKQYAVNATRVRAEQGKKPLLEHAEWLRFDLYTSSPAGLLRESSDRFFGCHGRIRAATRPTRM